MSHPPEPPPMTALRAMRRQAGGALMEAFFTGAARVGRLHPSARSAFDGVVVQRDLAYGPLREHRLDVYRPSQPTGAVVLYVHGGAFRILSKDTHWVFGLAFARAGFTVVSIDYRLAPAHPYPAALDDACLAYGWLVEHAATLGVDPRRIVVAGESAGANLVSSLTLAACLPRPEPFAQRVYALDRPPVAALPLCGILQVTDVERFWRGSRVSWFTRDRMEEVVLNYHPSQAPGTLADPLLLLESEQPIPRPLPPFFTSVGTADPLMPDSVRLEAALRARGVRCDLHVHPGQVHAFQAFVPLPEAQASWRALYGFLDEVVGRGE